jgi:hypothetical protein
MRVKRWAGEWTAPLVVFLVTACLFLLVAALLLSAGPR